MSKKLTTFTELFPIQPDALPKLHAYRADDASPDRARRLSRETEGRWAFSTAEGLLLTDTPPTTSDGLERVKSYKPTPTAQADYLIGALIPPMSDTLYHTLQTPIQGNFRVMQRPLFNGWEVNGSPALSIEIVQSLVYRLTLAEYAATIPNERGLIRLTVMSRSPLTDYRLIQGVVGAVVGKIGDLRETLARFATTESARKRLGVAPDNEPVVNVVTPFGAYQYPASELYITLSPKDYARMRVDVDAARKASYQNIDERARGVAATAGVLKAKNLIGDAYRADKSPKLFLSAAALDFSAVIQLGDHMPRPYQPRKLWAQLQEVGMYQQYGVDMVYRVGVLDALGSTAAADYAAQVMQAGTALNIGLGDVQTVTTPDLNAQKVEDAFSLFDGVGVLLALLPGRPPAYYSSDEDWKPYLNIKRAALARGMLAMCLWEADLKTPPDDIALGLAQMLGHTPFALGEPLPFVDLVVGITVTDAATMVQVYQNNGVFVGYIIHQGALSAEGAVRLFPEVFFKGTRVVLQTVAPIPEAGRALFQARANANGMTLHICGIESGRNPNLYAFAKKRIQQPNTGSAFLFSDTHALMVSAKPAHPAAPVDPVRVVTGARLPVNHALHTVLAMNILHPTARKPRLPVHLAHTGTITRLLRAGVIPTVTEGEIMWWL